MNSLEAIEKRRSRRTYLKTPIETEKISVIQGLIDEYNYRADLSIKLIADGSEAFNGLKKSYGLFKNVKTIIALGGKSNDIDLFEKIGRYGELLVLEATKMGLGTCWVGGTFDRESNMITMESDETLVCVITIGNIDNETLKEKLVHKIAARKTKTLDELYSSDCSVSDWFKSGMEAVQAAPSAKNIQPIKFEYKEGIVSAYIDATDNYKFYPVDLGIAKVHFELAAGGIFEIGNHGKYKHD